MPFAVLFVPSLVISLLLVVAPAGYAQGLVSGRAMLASSTRPLGCVDAALRRADGRVVATTFTREDGTFEFAAPAAGRYVVAFSTLGMVEAVAALDSLHPGSDVDRTFAVRLDPVDSLVEHVDARRADRRFPQPVRSTGAPRYPASELEHGREGGIVAAIVVAADGRIDTTLTSILYASAPPFEEAVRASFGPARYEPAQVNGQPRCSLLVLPYIFSLASGGTNSSPSFILGSAGALPATVVTALPVEQRGICPAPPDPSEETAPVYLPCHVDREAREARSDAVLNWEPAAGEITSRACFRAELRFIVDSLGVPEPATVSLVSTNNTGFGRAVAALVPDLRYQPARLKGRPVRQVVTLRESVGVVTSVQSGIGIGSSTPSRRTRC